MKNNKRPQAPKMHESTMRKIQDLRKSNAAGFHTPATAYKRSPKHRNRGWE